MARAWPRFKGVGYHFFLLLVFCNIALAASTADLSVSVHGAEAGPTAIEFTVTFDTANDSGVPITFDIRSTGGTAIAGSDYTAFPAGSISVADGATTGTFSVALINDSLLEATETLEATISNSSDPGVSIVTASATANITDNETPNADLSVTTQGDEAGPVNAVFTVTLASENQTGSSITFDIAPSGGTAAAGSDYTDFSGQQITVANGASTGTISVTVADDSVFEEDETLAATISNSSNPAVSINTASATATISDNETPNADLSVTTQGNETGPVGIVYTVTLSAVNNTGSSITFDIDPSGGTAAAGSDYTDFSGQQVTVANGASTGTISVTVADDSVFEDDETLEATISSPSVAAINISTASASASIIDNETPNAALSVTTQGNEAGPVSAVFTVTLAAVNNTGSSITFDIVPSGGNAVAGSDYTDFPSGQISVANGSATGTFSVTIADDTVFEDDETFEATISNSSDPAVSISTASATATITDNETPNADLAVTTHGAEPGTAIVYTLTLDTTNNTGSDITFDIDSSGTATSGSDYIAFDAGQFVITDGTNSDTVTVVVIEDALFETDETVIATISNPSDSAVVLNTPSIEATIADNDDEANSIDAVLSATVDGNENGPVNVVYTVTLTKENHTQNDLAFPIAKTGGSATSGVDFTGLASQIIVARGQSTGTLDLTPIADGLFENVEDVQLTISDPGELAINITGASATAPIADSNNIGGSIDADLSVTTEGNEEGSVDIVYTVTLATANNTGSAITFNIDRTGGTATPDDDYIDFIGAETISVANGASTGTFSVVVVNDGVFEADETVEATISDPGSLDPAISINTASATASIADNESAGADLTVTTHGDEEGTVSIVYTLDLDTTNNTGAPITFDINPDGGLAVENSDYTFADTSLSIANGGTSDSVTVAVLQDTLFEDTETLIATVSNPSDSAVTLDTPSATANILDNETPSADLTVSAHGDEDGLVSIVYTLTLAEANNTRSAITFDINPDAGDAGTATEDSDYTFADTSLSIADGTDSDTVTVTVLQDTLFENTETLIATVSNPSNAAVVLNTPSATASIADDDNTAGSIDAVLSVVSDGSEAGPQSVVYGVTLSKHNNSSQPISFSIAKTAGKAIDGTDCAAFPGGQISVPAGENNGTVTLAVTDDGLFENDEDLTATISSPSDPVISITAASATATITDNDNGVGSVGAVLSATTAGNEQGPVSAVFTVTLGNHNNTGNPITFDIAPTGGLAEVDTDFTDFTGQITVADGDISGTQAVVVSNDGLFENNESLQATISNPSDTAVAITTAMAEGTIIDNDNAAGSIGTTLAVTTHGLENGPVDIVYTATLALANNTHQNITFDIASTGGTAVVVDDYDAFDTTLTIPHGESQVTLNIPVVDDSLFENTETVQATLSSNSTDTAISLAGAVATANIIDSDNVTGSINATFSVKTHGSEVGSTSIVYEAELAKPNNTQAPITFDINATGGTADSTEDYTGAIIAGGEITIAIGETTGSFEVPVVDDGLFENQETLQATISSPSDSAINIVSGSATANIADNDNIDVDASIRVDRHGDENGPVSIIYTVELGKTNNTHERIDIDIDVDSDNSTADAELDFENFSGRTLTIWDGQKSVSETISVNNDLLFENDETVTAVISNPSITNIAIGTASAQATITDNDNGVDSVGVALSAEPIVTENGSSTITYTVTLTATNDTDETISVDIDPTGGTATAGADHNGSLATVIIPKGTYLATHTINVTDDTLFENDETVIATISNPSVAALVINTATATTTIADDDNTNASITADISCAQNGDEDGPGGDADTTTPIIYRVTLSEENQTGVPITFGIYRSAGSTRNVADEDYVAADLAGLISVPHGSATGDKSVAIIDDESFENTSSLSAGLRSQSDPAIRITTNSAACSIIDNDNTPGSILANVTATTNGSEDGPVDIVYTVSLSKANETGDYIYVDIARSGGSATPGSDFISFGTAPVQVGSSHTVAVIDDIDFEGPETLEVTISNPTDPAIAIGASSTAEATITDDDLGVTATLSKNSDGDEEQGIPIQYLVRLSKPNHTNSSITFEINPTGGTATAGADYNDFSGQTVSVGNNRDWGVFSSSVIDDFDVEGTETVEATISNPSSPYITIDTASATVDIYEDETVVPTFSAFLSTKNQGDEDGLESIEFQVSLSAKNSTGGDLVFNIDPNGGRATADADYEDFAGETITIPNGSSKGTLEVAVLQDDLFENQENIWARATQDAAQDAVVTIVQNSTMANISDDDNDPGSITYTIIATEGHETGPTNIVYTIELSKVNNTNNDISWSFAPRICGSTGCSTTVADRDYDSAFPSQAPDTGLIKVAKGTDTGTFTVDVLDDTNWDGTKTLVMVLDEPSDNAIYSSTGGSEVSGLIHDNDNGVDTVDATISLETEGSETGPTDAVMKVELSKANDTTGYVYFYFSKTGGNAVYGADYYNPTYSKISIYPGDTSGTVAIPIADDTVFENTETIEYTFAEPAATTVNLVSNLLTVTITDDDNAEGSIDASLEASQVGSEDGEQAIIYTVSIPVTNYTRAGDGSEAAITFDIDRTAGNATAGDDYTALAADQKITIPYGASFGTLSVAVSDDDIFENDETLTLTISNPSDDAINIATASAEGTIRDDDNTSSSIGAVLSVDAHGAEDDTGLEGDPIVYKVALSKINSTGSPITCSIDRTASEATPGAGEDFIDFDNGAQVSIPDGADEGTISLTVLNDDLFENREWIRATISECSDPAVYTQVATATGRIYDNDNDAGSIDTSIAVTTHGNESGPVFIEYTVTIAKVNNTNGWIGIDIDPTSVASNAATPGTDFYDFTNNSVWIPHGSDTGTFTVSVTDDTLFENEEEVEATLSNPYDNALNIVTASAVATIADNDNSTDTVEADLSVQTHGNETGEASIVYLVTLSAANNTHTDLTFDIAPTGGSADTGTDYAFDDATDPLKIIVPHGSLTGTYTVSVTDDDLFENDETVTATISNPSDGAVIIDVASATANLVDNDNATDSVDAVLSATSPAADGNEEASPSTTPITYTVTLAKVNNTHVPITFSINNTAGGTATVTADYVDIPDSPATTISVPDGSATGTIEVVVAEDLLFENDETVQATISSPSDTAVNIATPSALGTIVDDDNANGSIDIDLAVTTHGVESGPESTPIDIVYTATLASNIVNNTQNDITCDIAATGVAPTEATVGEDYTAFGPSPKITIARGEFSGTFTVDVIDDSAFENLEVLTLTISNCSDDALNINTASATANITDSDNVTDSISAVLSVEDDDDGNETGPDHITYTVTLSTQNNTHADLDFDIAPLINPLETNPADEGSDYTFASNTITVPDGSNTGTLTITVIDDSLFENLETMRAELSNSPDLAIAITGATADATITDNDNPEDSIDIDLSVATHGMENGPDPGDDPVDIVYTVELGGGAVVNNTHGTITCDIEATGSASNEAAFTEDYTTLEAGSQITILDGESSGTLSVPVVDDALFENLEVLTATISNCSDDAIIINTASATANITDDDNGAGAVNAVLSATVDGDEAGPSPITYTVTLSKANNTHQDIDFTISRGVNGDINEADPSTDLFDYAPSTITVPHGSAIGTFNVDVREDELFENVETVRATISDPGGLDNAINILTASADGNILDSDNAEGAVNIDLAVTRNGDEATAGGLGDIIYTVTLSTVNNTHGPLICDIRATGSASNEAALTEDYTNLDGSSTISIADGANTGNLIVPVVNDALFENEEVLTATISNCSDDALLINTASDTATITDNDNATDSIDIDLSVATNGIEDDVSTTDIVFSVELAGGSIVNNTHGAITCDIEATGSASNEAAFTEDYTTLQSGSQITIADGASSGTLTVPVVNDSLFENPEVLTATISNCSDGALTINTASDTATITDNDNGTDVVGAVLSAVSPAADGNEEGLVAITYTVTLAKANNTHEDITFSISRGVNGAANEAVPDVDFVDFSADTITVAHGSTTGTYEVAVLQDTLFENIETVRATISSPSDTAVNILAASADGKILDNDNAADSHDIDLSVTRNGDEATAGGLGDIIYTVTLSTVNNTHGPLTCDIRATGSASNEAALTEDYTNLNGTSTISISDGASTGTLTVPVEDDDLFENLEVLTATISNCSDGALLINTASAQAEIADNDNGAGSIDADLSVEDDDDGEETGEEPIVYTVTLAKVNNTHSPITFDIAPTGGTATVAGLDYTDFTGTISVPDGSSTGTLSVAVNDDSLFENSETVIATISAPVGIDPAISINTASAEADIIDNDNGAGSIDADLSVTTHGDEAGTDIVYTVTLSTVNNTGSAIEFNIDPTGGTADSSDYVATDFDPRIEVAPGSDQGTLEVEIVDDSLFENLETLVATISDPGAPNELDAAININTADAEADIADSDNGAGTIDASIALTSHGTESGLDAVVFTVTISTTNNTHNPVVFNLNPPGGTATSGADYTGFPATISVADGEISGSISISVEQDELFENTETVVATISSSPEAAMNIVTASASGNIVDDDNDALSIDADLSVEAGGDGHEGDPATVDITYTVTLAKVNNTGSPIAFDINPTGGTANAADYEATDFDAQIIVANGLNQGTLEIGVVDDSLFENTETLIATISAPVGLDSAININTADAEADIADNDNGAGTIDAVLSVEDGDDGAEAGTPITYTVTLSTVNNTGRPIAFDIAATGGTASTSDYETTDFDAQIVVPDGSNVGTLTVDIVNDSLFENTETLIATISAPVGIDPAINISDADAEANIADSDNGAGTINAVLSVEDGDDGAEGGTPITYTVTLSTVNNTGSPIAFDIAPTGGTASSADYVTTDFDAQIVVPDGSDVGTLAIRVVNDSLFESTETLVATISDPGDLDAAINISDADAEANIVDNDSGTGSVDATLSATRAGNEDGLVRFEYTVTLSSVNNTGSGITFEIDPSGGTADAGSDYVDFSAGGTITVPDGASTGTASFDVIDDSAIENTETVEATISSPSNNAINIAGASATANILDEDYVLGGVDATLSVTTHGDEDGPVDIEYTVTLSAINNTNTPITFDIAPTGGTATVAALDFTDFTGSISVPDGSDTGTLTVGVNNDDLFENRETVTATISNPSDLVINIVGASATANIEDNDNIAGSIDADLSVEDGDHGDEAGPDPIVYTVTLTEVNNTHSPITFNIAQVGGTATGGGVDYEDFASPTISVPHGARTGTLSVVVVGDDGLFENIETVIATISDPGAPTPLDSAININTPSVTANIIDEDNASDSISADFSVTTDGNEEGPVPISLLVTLGVANNTGTAITFDLAQIGGTATTIADYADIAGATISVADGATTGTLDLAVVDDADLEGDETVVFQISNESDPAVQITTATDTADILENDGSPGAIKADLSVTAHGNEEGPVSIEYMVTLSALNGTGSDITVDITRSSGTADVGADYAAFSSPTITIPDGASQGSLTVTVLEDDLFENDETITATISNPSHAAVAVRQATATANIVDSDNTSIDATLSLQTQGAEEGSVPMVFELALAKVNNTHQPITMTIEPSGGTATSGSDYSAFAGTQLSIPHGSQSAQLTVTVNDDNTLEANETIIVTLSNASDSAINFTNSPFTVSIPDNEATGEDDGDGLLNSDECPTGEGSCPDTDGDGLPNYQDSDDDGDGIPTRVECPDRLACVDTDGDSLPDYLEHNFLDTDDDGIPDREDRDDDNDGILTINELGSALSVGANELGHALSLQDSDGDGIPTYLDPDEDGPGSGDSDEDGFSDAEECPEGYLCPDSDGDSTPDYMQAATEALRSPFYTIWNSFFEQSNIIALLNKHHTSVGVTVTLFTRHGVPITEQSITLEGHQELDLILNNMPGYPENSYGLAKVEFDSVHALEGHSASYRAEPYNSQSESVDGMGLEFGILRPFSNPIKGESFAFFNTIQPSQVPFEADHVVPHWVQIGNTDETDTKRFTVKKYDIFGNEIQATVIAVPAQGRVDVDGGHVFPGRNAVGLIQIIPEDTEATYLAQVFHYGYNSEDVEQPNGFSFAMGERMRIGINKPQYLNVSNGAGARNWLTIANVGDASDTVNLLILDNNGSELVNHDFALGVNQQVHFLASDALGVNHSGMAIITSTGLGRVISNSRMYYYDEFGSVTSASLMEERYSLGSEVYALYNTYFEQLNWLSVFNLSDDTITFNVEAYNQDGSLKSSVPMEITSGTGVDAEIIHSLGVELEADRYGVLKIVPNQSGQYYAVIRRIKPGDDITTVDLGKPIPLR